MADSMPSYRRYRRGKKRCRVCGLKLSDPHYTMFYGLDKGHKHHEKDNEKVWAKKLWDESKTKNYFSPFLETGIILEKN